MNERRKNTESYSHLDLPIQQYHFQPDLIGRASPFKLKKRQRINELQLQCLFLIRRCAESRGQEPQNPPR